MNHWRIDCWKIGEKNDAFSMGRITTLRCLLHRACEFQTRLGDSTALGKRSHGFSLNMAMVKTCKHARRSSLRRRESNIRTTHRREIDQWTNRLWKNIWINMYGYLTFFYCHFGWAAALAISDCKSLRRNPGLCRYRWATSARPTETIKQFVNLSTLMAAPGNILRLRLKMWLIITFEWRTDLLIFFTCATCSKQIIWMAIFPVKIRAENPVRTPFWICRCR